MDLDQVSHNEGYLLIFNRHKNVSWSKDLDFRKIFPLQS
jgi:hypothetical protein